MHLQMRFQPVGLVSVFKHGCGMNPVCYPDVKEAYSKAKNNSVSRNQAPSSWLQIVAKDCHPDCSILDIINTHTYKAKWIIKRFWEQDSSGQLLKHHPTEAVRTKPLFTKLFGRHLIWTATKKVLMVFTSILDWINKWTEIMI